MTTSAKVLLIEDEAIIALEMAQYLSAMGYQVVSGVSGARKALATVEREKPDLILMDIRLKGDMDGIETAAEIRSRFDIPIVFLTAYLDEERIGRAKLTMPFGYLLKPVQARDLKVTVEMALYTARIDRERRAVEASLAESERKFRDLFEGNRDGIVVLGVDGRFLEANQAYCDIIGYSIEELRQSGGFLQITPKRWHEWEYNEIWKRRLLKDGYTGVYEKEYIHRTGRVFPVEVQGFTVFHSSGAPHYIWGVIRDISQRKEAEKEIVLLRNQLISILDTIPSIIVTVDDKHCVDYWNRKAETVTGLMSEQVRGRPFIEVLPDYQRQVVGHLDWVLQNGGTRTINRVIRYRNGESGFDNITISPLTSEALAGAVIKIDDITEQVRLEEVMIQTEKMTSLGGLAAGMAHEINNPLGGMIQGTQNVIRRFSPELKANQAAAAEAGIDLDRLQIYLEKREIPVFLQGIQQSGRKASDIIANMLQFSRRSESQMAPVQLHQLLDNIVELAGKNYDLKRTTDFRNIRIVRAYDPLLSLVPCTETEIGQVILNLLSNAAWAMGEAKTSEPCITLRTLKEENSARIEIEDNGPGIEEKVRRRIFEPFYTTKPVGSGTGLGLSVSFMIITHNHRGTIEVESEPGNGTRFIIHLPLVRENNRNGQ
jgi:PAS domain S-box-containing protein